MGSLLLKRLGGRTRELKEGAMGPQEGALELLDGTRGTRCQVCVILPRSPSASLSGRNRREKVAVTQGRDLSEEDVPTAGLWVGSKGTWQLWTRGQRSRKD